MALLSRPLISSHKSLQYMVCTTTDGIFHWHMDCFLGKRSPYITTCSWNWTIGVRFNLKLSLWIMDWRFTTQLQKCFHLQSEEVAFFIIKRPFYDISNTFNLIEEYSVADSPMRQCFAMVGAIAFVPEVDETWMMLKPLLSPDMIEFTKYYEAAWIGSSGHRPTFAHDMWNQNTASRSLLQRSTNIAEGWHRGFNSMLGCSNPTIWKFPDCVKAEQSLTDLKKMMKERSEQRAASWIHYDRRIQELVDDYQNYENKMNFLKAIGYLTM